MSRLEVARPARRRAAARWLRAGANLLGGADEALVTALAVLLAFAAGALVIGASDEEVLRAWGDLFSDPLGALELTVTTVADAYGALLKGAILNPQGDSLRDVLSPLSETIVAATPLMLSGGQGQVILGAAAAGFVGFHFDLPPGVHLVAAVAAGFAAGALWGFVPGWLKAQTGAHEVITTIMLNYVATILVVYLLALEVFQRPGRTDPISPLVRPDARLPHLLGDELRIHLGILMALAVAGGLWWVLSRTTLGFQLRAVGQNLDAARTAGISAGRIYVIAMALAGGVAGLAGTATMLGTEFTLTPGTASTIGFAGLSVALLGRATVKGTVAASFLFGGLQAGGIQMQASTGTPVDLVTIIQALIVLFIAAPMVVRAVFRLRSRGPVTVSAMSRGWSA